MNKVGFEIRTLVKLEQTCVISSKRSWVTFWSNVAIVDNIGDGG